MAYNQSSGWAVGGGSSLVIAIQADKAVYSVSGNPYGNWGSSFGNASSLRAVFEEYRINKIWIDLYWTNNDIVLSGGGTYAFPMLYTCIDQNDGNALTGSDECLQYASCQVVQLGNTPNIPNRPAIRLSQRDPRHRLSTDTTTLGTNANGVMTTKGQWLATDLTTCETGYFKLWLDPIFTTNLATIGQLTGVINVEYEFRNVH